jgi:ubiquinone/menaquinone biosynthesis C-methylase UbiE
MSPTIQSATAHLGPMFEAIAADGMLVLDRLALSPGARVLDVGTGVGNFAIVLALNGFEVVTGEPENDSTHYAGHDWAANADAVGVRDRIRFEAFDAHQMPFEDHTFDAVFFFGVLHHIDEKVRGAAFQEALRVAKPGATVAYFEPSASTLQRVWETDPGHPIAATPSDYRGDLQVRETRMSGAIMDIYLFET